MADDTKNLEISVTDEDIEEIESGRTKQASMRLNVLKKEIEDDEAALKTKKEKLKKLEDAAKNRRLRTRALCNIAGRIIKISGLSWQELDKKNGVEDWAAGIKAKAAQESLEKYKSENPVLDLRKVRNDTLENPFF